eukprot:TRINITY_DN33557_c0_g1_i1.p1 TRINITY_DN33557_c0_g1~~TRINITY_DN33557_c0_g1_i1.p1  ORF type:complete len:312 (+),score=24.58 TRINITY_DN33557_c0_g1_i1:58-936(+)
MKSALVILVLLMLCHGGMGSETDRMNMSVNNWARCPTSEQTALYTVLLIESGLTFQWPSEVRKCTMPSPFPICNNQPNAALVSKWQSEGKQVILLFDGVGMADCWFGEEDFVVDQLVEIVSVQGLDGIDIFEPYDGDRQKSPLFAKCGNRNPHLNRFSLDHFVYSNNENENGQGNCSLFGECAEESAVQKLLPPPREPLICFLFFDRPSAKVQKFLREVTQKLRWRLPLDKIVLSTPMNKKSLLTPGDKLFLSIFFVSILFCFLVFCVIHYYFAPYLYAFILLVRVFFYDFD